MKRRRKKRTRKKKQENGEEVEEEDEEEEDEEEGGGRRGRERRQARYWREAHVFRTGTVASILATRLSNGDAADREAAVVDSKTTPSLSTLSGSTTLSMLLTRTRVSFATLHIPPIC